MEHGEGWKRVFGWLQGYVEQGETVDMRSGANILSRGVGHAEAKAGFSLRSK
jgi:hypothetical protein